MRQTKRYHLPVGIGVPAETAMVRRTLRSGLMVLSILGRSVVVLFIGMQITVATHGQSLDAYLDMAVETSPQLQASFKAYETSLEKVNQVTLESPQVSIGVFTKPMELLMGNQRADASVMQMFPWFGMLKTQKDEMTLMAEANYEEFRQQRNTVLFQVKELYYQLWQLEHTIEVTRSNLEILKTLENLAVTRFQGGNISEVVSSVSATIRKPAANRPVVSAAETGMDMGGNGMSQGGMSSSGNQANMAAMSGMGGGSASGRLTDVLRIQVQMKGLESDLEQFQVDKRPLLAKFNRLVGRPALEQVDLESVVETQRAQGWETAFLDSILTYNPMLLMLEKEGQVYQKQGQMARLEGKPMFGAGVNYMVFSARPESGMPGGVSHGMEYMPSGMGKNMIMPMVTVTLPIYRKKYKSMAAESKMWGEANERRKEDAKGVIYAEFEAQLSEIRNAERRIALFGEQIALTEKTLELAVTAYATEGTSFEEILNIQKELLDFRLQKLNTALDREIGYARLESLVGY